MYKNFSKLNQDSNNNMICRFRTNECDVCGLTLSLWSAEKYATGHLIHSLVYYSLRYLYGWASSNGHTASNRERVHARSNRGLPSRGGARKKSLVVFKSFVYLELVCLATFLLITWNISLPKYKLIDLIDYFVKKANHHILK